jgi:hypothetical protein
MKSILTTLGLAVVLATPAAAQNFGPPELIAAAKKEGRLVFYTANFAEVEQEVIKAFNKRFPEIKVEMVRAPGGQLITRIKTEAAAGKLSADVVNHSDRGLMLELENLFMDYTPPNAGDYLPDVLVSPKFWPQATLGWAIAYNSAIVKNPPKTWMDLTKPEYKGKQIRTDDRAFRRHHLTRVMFERQVLGEDYWKKQAATEVVLFPSARRPPTRWCAADLDPAVALQHRLHQAARRCADRDRVRARGHAAQRLRRRRPVDRQEPECRQAVSQLVPVGRRPDLHDQGAGQPDLVESAAGAGQGLRPEQGEVMGAELQAVPGAARDVDRGLEPGLQLPPVNER